MESTLATPDQQPFDDERMAGWWSAAGGELASSLRAKRRGWRWWGSRIVLLVSVAMLALTLGEWALTHEAPRPTSVASAVCNVVTWTLLALMSPGRRPMQFRATPAEIWMGKGLGRRTCGWDEIQELTYSAKSSQSVQLVLRRAGSGAGAATVVARPVAERFLEAAHAHGIEPRETPANNW